ncbi:hypothetical protein Ancab_036288 [Ancistrocladus abbreviatus]
MLPALFFCKLACLAIQSLLKSQSSCSNITMFFYHTARNFVNMKTMLLKIHSDFLALKTNSLKREGAPLGQHLVTSLQFMNLDCEVHADYIFDVDASSSCVRNADASFRSILHVEESSKALVQD